MKAAEPMFSLTAHDFEWSYTKGTGAGGQKRNKTSSAVHCKHAPSGSHGYSEGSRSQHQNKREAFERCIHTPKFREWLRLESMRRSGHMAEAEREVERQMKLIKVEVRKGGRWVELEREEPIR
jgi:protein subunit release factor B